MKARYINELTEGMRVAATFLMRSKELRIARNGDPYLWLELSDRSGGIPGVMFRPADVAAVIPVGTVVRVEGTVTSFRGRRRVSIGHLAPAESWEPADLLAEGTRPADEVVAEFRALGASVSHKGLRAVLRRVFGDDVFMQRFCECPASDGEHHVHVRGLLEHTVAVATICDDLSARYTSVDRDLLVTAALLHDIGRVDELSFGAGVAHTDAGLLLGHTALGSRRAHDATVRTGLDQQVAVRLEHAVLAHHGDSDGGLAPRTAEALLLQQVDELDAAADGFASSVAGAARADERWTDSANAFGRSLLTSGRNSSRHSVSQSRVVALSA